MASEKAYKRLTREYRKILKNPTPFIIAKPLESNILEWHYVITGPPDTPYHNGEYHGVLLFPSDYPYKPPAIKMITPNGRFKTDFRLCLSISDYHPKTWSSAWGVSTILTGLLSFMVEEKRTLGSIETSNEKKIELSKKSREYNRNDIKFREIFPELCDDDGNGNSNSPSTIPPVNSFIKNVNNSIGIPMDNKNNEVEMDKSDRKDNINGNNQVVNSVDNPKNDDPDLALALQLSLEEEKARKNQLEKRRIDDNKDLDVMIVPTKKKNEKEEEEEEMEEEEMLAKAIEMSMESLHHENLRASKSKTSNNENVRASINGTNSNENIIGTLESRINNDNDVMIIPTEEEEEEILAKAVAMSMESFNEDNKRHQEQEEKMLAEALAKSMDSKNDVVPMDIENSEDEDIARAIVLSLAEE